MKRDSNWFSRIKQLKEFESAYRRGRVKEMPEDLLKWFREVIEAGRLKKLSKEQLDDLLEIPGVEVKPIDKITFPYERPTVTEE